MTTSPFTRRSVLTMGAIGLSAAGLAACGSGSSGKASGGATQKEVDTSKLEGEITFQTQGLKGTFDDFFTKLISKFESEHPGTKVTWTDLPGSDDFDTTMVTQASNKTMADVINVPSSTVLALSKGDFLLDIDSASPGIGDKFVPTVWDKLGLGPNGETTALPWYFGPFVTTYNKKIFQDAGLDPEVPPATMDEYFEFAKTITGAGKQAVYGNTSWYMLQQWRAYGVTMMNDDATEFVFANDKQALAWITNMAELYKNGGIPKDSITGDLDMSKTFGEGALAFGTPNASFVRSVRENAPEVYANTGVGGEALNSGISPLFSGQYIAVAKESKNVELAVAFAEWFTDIEQGKAWAQYGIDTETAVVFPVTTDALNQLASSAAADGSEDDAFTQARKIAAEQAVKAEAYLPDFYVTGAVAGALNDNVNLAIVGNSEPQAALDTAQAEMNKLLERLNR